MQFSNKHIVLADQVVVSGSAFATNLLLAKVLGIETYGLYSEVVLYQLFVLGLLQASFSGLVPVMLARVQAGLHRSYTGGLFWLHQAIITLLFVSCVLLCWLLPAVSVSSWIMPAASSALLYFMQDYLRKWMLSSKQCSKALIMDVVTNAAQLFLLAATWYLQVLNLTMALWIIAITFLPSVVIGLLWLKPGSISKANMIAAFRMHAPEAKWTSSSALLQWSSGNYFVMAAGWWLGPAALGALRLAQYIFGLLNVLLQAVEHAMLPQLAVLHNKPVALFKKLRILVVQMMAMLLPILLLLVLFQKWIMEWAGSKDFAEYSFAFSGLAILYVLIIIGYGIRLAMRVQLLNKHYFFGYVLATCFSMLSATWLVGHFALHGILAGMIAAQLLLLSYWIWVLARKNNNIWKSFTLYWGK